MMKEDDLISCVLEVLKAYISNVASLEALLAEINAEKLGSDLAKALTGQLAENERRLEKIRVFKAGLFESMIDGNLSKEEHKSLKIKYSEDIDDLTAVNERLRREIDDALSCKHERLAWIGYFREFASLETLDRKTVATLIKSIKIKGKREIEIEFNYKAEYEAALALVQKEAA
jgi:hypothetical protein